MTLSKHYPKKTFWCRVGWHTWYYSTKVSPYFGKYTRYCMQCGLVQVKQDGKWVDLKS